LSSREAKLEFGSLSQHSSCYFRFIMANELASGRDWLYGVGMLLLILVVTVILPVQGLKRKDSPYEIPEWQVEQFEKVRSFASIHRNP